MAAAKAGAAVPAAVTVNGVEVSIDRDAASTWDAFKLLRIINDEDADELSKMEAAIAYASLISNLDEESLVGIAGGGSAQIADVMDVVAQVIAAATPKN